MTQMQGTDHGFGRRRQRTSSQPVEKELTSDEELARTTGLSVYEVREMRLKERDKLAREQRGGNRRRTAEETAEEMIRQGLLDSPEYKKAQEELLDLTGDRREAEQARNDLLDQWGLTEKSTTTSEQDHDDLEAYIEQGGQDPYDLMRPDPDRGATMHETPESKEASDKFEEWRRSLRGPGYAKKNTQPGTPASPHHGPPEKHNAPNPFGLKPGDEVVQEYSDFTAEKQMAGSDFFGNPSIGTSGMSGAEFTNRSAGARSMGEAIDPGQAQQGSNPYGQGSATIGSAAVGGDPNAPMNMTGGGGGGGIGNVSWSSGGVPNLEADAMAMQGQTPRFGTFMGGGLAGGPGGAAAGGVSGPLSGASGAMGPSGTIVPGEAAATTSGANFGAENAATAGMMAFGFSMSSNMLDVKPFADEFPAAEVLANNAGARNQGLLEELSRETTDPIARSEVSRQLGELDSDSSLTPDQKLAKAVEIAKLEREKLREEITEMTLDLVYGEGMGNEKFGNMVEEMAVGNISFSRVYNNPNCPPAVKRELARLIADPAIRNILIPPIGNVNSGFNGGGGYEGPATRGAWNQFTAEEQNTLSAQMKTDYEEEFSGIEESKRMPFDLWKRFNSPPSLMRARYEAHVLSSEAMDIVPESFEGWSEDQRRVAEKQWEYRKNRPQREAERKRKDAERRVQTAERRAEQQARRDAMTNIRSHSPIVRASAYADHPHFMEWSVEEKALHWFANTNQIRQDQLRMLFHDPRLQNSPMLKDLEDAEAELHAAEMGKDKDGKALGSDAQKAAEAAEKKYAIASFTLATSPSMRMLEAMHDENNAKFIPFVEAAFRQQAESERIRREHAHEIALKLAVAEAQQGAMEERQLAVEEEKQLGRVEMEGIKQVGRRELLEMRQGGRLTELQYRQAAALETLEARGQLDVAMEKLRQEGRLELVVQRGDQQETLAMTKAEVDAIQDTIRHERTMERDQVLFEQDLQRDEIRGERTTARDQVLFEQDLQRDEARHKRTMERDEEAHKRKLELQERGKRAVGRYSTNRMTDSDWERAEWHAGADAAMDLVGQELPYDHGGGGTVVPTEEQVSLAIESFKNLPTKPVDRMVWESTKPGEAAILYAVASAMVTGRLDFLNEAKKTQNEETAPSAPESGTTQTLEWHYELVRELAGDKQISHSDLLKLYEEETNRQGVEPHQMVIKNLKPATAD